MFGGSSFKPSYAFFLKAAMFFPATYPSLISANLPTKPSYTRRANMAQCANIANCGNG